MPSSCNDEVFLRIPNLKKLVLLLVDDIITIKKCCCVENHAHLTQLENLNVEVNENYLRILRWIGRDRVDPFSPWLHIPHCNSFPPNLKKLALCRTHLQWEHMNFLSKLPNLEVIKLKNDALHGQILKLRDEDEDGFLQLKYLPLKSMHLQQCEATSYHFPSLERLVITDCYSLEKIPFDFAEIQTL